MNTLHNKTLKIIVITFLVMFFLTAGTKFNSAFAQTSFDCSTVTEIPVSECEALVSFYDSTEGSNWTNNDNWLITDTPCNWFGISCENDHVTEIVFRDNNLVGFIPPEIGSLTDLTTLSLTINQLMGSIPSEIGLLINLENLLLLTNQLQGPIPPEIGSLLNLKYLALHDNQLTGELPQEIGDLINLEHFLLSANNFTGQIPASFGNLNNLKQLFAPLNKFSGELPTELCQLSNIHTLNFSMNYLSGEIPSCIGNLSNLETLALYNNQLSGSIPSEIGLLNQLKVLYLNGNFLSGEIPHTIIDLSNLTQLNIACNRLTSSDPAVLAFLDIYQPDWQENQCWPTITAAIDHEWVDAWGYENGEEIFLEIREWDSTGDLVYSGSAITQIYEWSGGNPVAVFYIYEDSDIDMVAGHFLTVTNGFISTEMVIEDLSFNELNHEDDTASGAGPIGDEVEIYLWNDLERISVLTTINDQGEWFYDFSGEYDITEEGFGHVVQL